MKRFAIEVLGLSLLLLVIGSALYYSEIPYPLAKKISQIDSPLEVVNLGTSHGEDFDYATTTLNGADLSREGNTIYYDLQTYTFLSNADLLTDSAILLIPVSYYAFGLDENRTDRLPDDSFVNDFYHFLPKEQIYNYSERKNRSLVIHTIQQNFINLFIHSKPIYPTTDLDLHAQGRSKHHKQLAVFTAEGKNMQHLEHLIGQAINNGHRPVLISTPYYKAYNEAFGLSWLQEHYFSKLYRLSKRFHIPYLDYSHDTRFTNNKSLFFNSDHLNQEGRNVFSAVVFEDVDKALSNQTVLPIHKGRVR